MVIRTGVNLLLAINVDNNFEAKKKKDEIDKIYDYAKLIIFRHVESKDIKSLIEIIEEAFEYSIHIQTISEDIYKILSIVEANNNTTFFESTNHKIEFIDNLLKSSEKRLRISL